MQRERAVERARVRIDEELRRIETVAVSWVVRPVRAQPVAATCIDVRDEPVEDVARALGQRDALQFALPRRIEQTQFNRRRMSGKHGDVDAAPNHRHTERLGAPGIDAAHRRSS